jgi:tRNA pseudouridine55 synthase
MRRRGRSDLPPGVLLVDKPAGPSSHAVVDWVRWVLRDTRVGHCGTLDPAATGLLVIVVGSATRLAAHLTDADKVYEARFVFGRSTTTADAEGETLELRACDHADQARALDAVGRLVGAHELPPPHFSAVKVAGVAAHVRARGTRSPAELEPLAPRSMVVRSVDGARAVVEPAVETVAIDVTLQVSKGTYIRSLAELLGRQIGRPAHLGALRRVRSGTSSIADPRVVGPLRARPLDVGRDGKPRWRVRPDAGLGDDDREGQERWLRARMLGLHEAWPLPWIELPTGEQGDRVLRRLLQGQTVEVGAMSGPPTVRGRVGVGRSGAGGAFVVGRIEGETLHPERTIARPEAAGAA